MKVINPGFEELIYSNPIELGEVCTRVCYKSEDKIKEGSAKKLITGVANAGHTAMLEHIPVYFKGDWILLTQNTYVSKIITSPYTKKRVDCFTNMVYVSTNLRVLHEHCIELYEAFMEHDGEPFIDKDFCIEFCKCSDDDKFFPRYTIKFTMDRIGSQSFCRHRTFSFAQESTRWVNYIKEKFGSEISVILPCWLKEEDFEEFRADMELEEKLYFKWLNKGYKAEEARAFLPFGVKTEIIMTGFADAWQHFFSLRNDSHAHPQAQELAKPLEEYFKNKKYI